MKIGDINDRMSQAIAFACMAHDGQERKPPEDNVPYIVHCLRVMLAVQKKYAVVAVLHDVYEDTGTFPPDSIITEVEKEALKLLSRTDGQEYSDYIAEICIAPGEAGEIARAVKVADVYDNLTSLGTTKVSQRIKYRAALRALYRIQAMESTEEPEEE